MKNSFLDGIKFSLGILLVFSLLGIVFAVGFHNADEILSGTFNGSFIFDGNVDFTSATVSGLSSSGGVPVGSTMAYFTANCPTGWLKTDGSAISRITYSDLFNEIGVMYGSGDGTTTFNLPDTRGYFLRSTAEGSSMDPDRASRTNRGDGTTGDNVGTKQNYQLQSHNHNFIYTMGSSGGSYPGNIVSHYEMSSSSSVAISSSGGTETRPRNINVLYCIKY